MKKLAAFLVILTLLMASAVPVLGEGVYVISENGDAIKIFEDAANGTR